MINSFKWTHDKENYDQFLDLINAFKPTVLLQLYEQNVNNMNSTSKAISTGDVLNLRKTIDVIDVPSINMSKRSQSIKFREKKFLRVMQYFKVSNPDDI